MRELRTTHRRPLRALGWPKRILGTTLHPHNAVETFELTNQINEYFGPYFNYKPWPWLETHPPQRTGSVSISIKSCATCYFESFRRFVSFRNGSGVALLVVVVYGAYTASFAPSHACDQCRETSNTTNIRFQIYCIGPLAVRGHAYGSKKLSTLLTA